MCFHLKSTLRIRKPLRNLSEEALSYGVQKNHSNNDHGGKNQIMKIITLGSEALTLNAI
jgi:hypothetical protein